MSIFSRLYGGMAYTDEQSGRPADHSARRLLSEYELEGRGTEVHVASISEKKRLWWRNASINCLFITSWRVHDKLTWHSLPDTPTI